MKVPVAYKINISKQNTQLVQDFQTLAQIIGGGTAAAAATAEYGYYTAFDFNSSFATSSVQITAALPNATTNQATPNPTSTSNASGSAAKGGTAANSLATQTYVNEKPAYVGLSVAVPLNSYKDLTYNQSSTTFTPNVVNRQNVYVTVDFYLPPSEPGLMTLRWVPHPFFGIPLKGQPLKNTAVGFGLGLRWLEPFAAVVFNEQERLIAPDSSPQNHWVRKGIFGVKISVSALKTALSSSSSKSSSK